jgi:tetratricopeptide (TPR) repeat protein
MLRLLTFATCCLLLAACASLSPDPELATDTETSSASEPAQAAAVIPERHFPDDSLYSLLVAEFALRRQGYAVALERYLAQAPTLRDAGVSAHTTHLGQFMQREHETMEATRLWVELDPDNVEANSIYATMLVRQGRTVEALPYLANTERNGKATHFPVLLTRFNALSSQQRTELIAGVNELAIEFPENTSLILTQVLIDAELEHYDRARTKLKRLFELEPTQTQALLLEARIRVELKEKKPFKHIDRVLKEQPENKLLRMQYARLLTGIDMSAAREQFEILSSQSPRDGDLLFSLALINREIGDYPAAAAYLHQVLALEQRVDEANFSLGRISEDTGDLEQALSYYMQVGDSREYLAANNRIGQILVAAGELEESHAWFAQQRELDPRQREPLYRLEADVLASSGDLDRAVQLLDEALSETPGDALLLYARAMLNEQRGDVVAMERDLRTILAAEPGNITALNALGYTLANRTTRYAEAIELISRALEMQPEEPAILDSMGWVLYRTGRLEESLQYLTRAYARFPDAEVAAHLGEVLWLSGQTDAALAVWRGAVLQHPDHPVLRSTLERLGIESLDDDSSENADARNQP